MAYWLDVPFTRLMAPRKSGSCWLATTLAAVFGTAALSPITDAGHSGLAWQEKLITATFMTVGIDIIACALLTLWGLRRKTATT